MELKLCDRCKKNTAVVFVIKQEGNVRKNEGICIACARELGISQITDFIDSMGIHR